MAAAGGDGKSGRRRSRQRSPEVAIDGVAAAAAGGEGGSGRRRCQRLVEAAVNDGGSHGRHERLHEAYKCGGGVFNCQVCVRIRIFLLSVFVALSSDGGSDKL